MWFGINIFDVDLMDDVYFCYLVVVEKLSQ